MERLLGCPPDLLNSGHRGWAARTMAPGPLAPTVSDAAAPSSAFGEAAMVGATVVSMVLASVVAVAEPDPWFGEDKLKHFSVSAGLGVATTGVSPLVSDSLAVQLAFAGGLSLSVGLGKEVLDGMGGSGFSVRDLTWDAAGTAVGILVVWAVDRLFIHPGPLLAALGPVKGPVKSPIAPPAAPVRPGEPPTKVARGGPVRQFGPSGPVLGPLW